MNESSRLCWALWLFTTSGIVYRGTPRSSQRLVIATGVNDDDEASEMRGRHGLADEYEMR